LKTQWDALKPGDDAARLLLRVAGQFAEAAAIPTAMLGLFTGVPEASEPGDPSPLGRALKRLHDVRLVEELLEDRVRLHPLVREFAEALTPQDETANFRHACACRVVRAFEDISAWEDTVLSKGVDGFERCLTTARDFVSPAEDSVQETLSSMLRVFRREAHHLREWAPQHQPNAFAQQIQFRAATSGVASLAEKAEQHLSERARPCLLLRWRTLNESPALVRLLTGHQRGVRSVAVSPDGRRIVSGSDDHTVAVWDLEGGTLIYRLTGHEAAVRSVAVGPDNRHIVSGSEDHTVAVWDPELEQRLAVLRLDGPILTVVCHRDGRSIVAGDTGGNLYRLEYRQP
jgi:hypothetical protein